MVFEKKIKRYISDNKLLEDNSSVVVGVSGGADSTALLRVLLTLGYRCIAVHCNFHLRNSESDRDQQFVEDLCKNLGVELITCSYDTSLYSKQNGISIEMAARELRYSDFERIMQERGASAICIAHHRDDSVETLMLNLIRGTGLRGLTGIKPKNGHIIRPLLCVSRQDIEVWLKETGQPYVTDSTNFKTDYTRNKIRLELLPLIRNINPNADSSIESTALHLQQAYAFYFNAIEKARKEITQTDGDVTIIDIDKLKLTPSVQALLFEILSPLGFNDTQITAVAAALDSQPGTEFASTTHRIVKDRDSFIVSTIGEKLFTNTEFYAKSGVSIDLHDGRIIYVNTATADAPISKDPSVATFDADLINGQLLIRLWKEGDWFIPFGMKGRKLISDYLTDSKVSAAERKKQLVVTQGNDIIWLVGLRSDNRYRINKNTTQQLILTIK